MKKNQCAHQSHLPKYQLPCSFISSGQYLRHLVDLQIKQKYNKVSQKVKQRAEYELTLIEEKGWSDYFLILWDIINFVKSQKRIVGPGRGSAPGSLVNYLLGIINVNPLVYDLYFERFVPADHIKLPDIDTNFSIQGRELALEYVEKIFGKDHTSPIMTLGVIKPEAFIQEISNLLDLSEKKKAQLIRMIPLNSRNFDRVLNQNEHLRNILSKNKELQKALKNVTKLNYLTHTVGKHGSAILISPEKISETIGLCSSEDGETVTQMDKESLEELGYMTVDFLSMKELTIIESIIEKVKKNYDIQIELEKIPLNDQKTLQLFSSGKTDHVFQFNNKEIQNYLKKLKPDRFEDLVILNSLYRPGPLERGWIEEFIRRKNREIEIDYLLPELEPVLSETYGMIVFQEQVMEIYSSLSGLSLNEANKVMKAIGKKHIELIEMFKKKLIKATRQKGYQQEKVEAIFNLMRRYGPCSINKSHTVSYTLIGFQMVYLKTHFPKEFEIAANEY